MSSRKQRLLHGLKVFLGLSFLALAVGLLIGVVGLLALFVWAA